MLLSKHFLSLYAFSALATAYAAIGPVADLEIANARIAPDGFERAAVLAGGTFPGPVIKGNKGDRFQLNVVNHLTDGTMAKSTSVHWHGIFQRGTNFADGAASVTQCPIATQESFLYDFPVKDQAGTFWYHSHLSTQYCDGLRGAFVVYDRNDPHRFRYDIDDESTIITLADWYHEPAHTLLGPGKLPPESIATLINGKGRYIGGPQSELAVVNVQWLKRYRFRIVAMSCDPAFTFSIDNHLLTIIEADGENTAPLVVNSLDIYAGQRYSVILNANKLIGNYWIRANPNRGSPGFDGGRNSAILRYKGAPNALPTTTQPKSVIPLKEVNLHPLSNPAAPGIPRPGAADVNLNLVTSVNFTTFKYEMNGAPFTPLSVPVLLQILSGTKAAQDLLPKGSVYPLPANKVIEISLPGTAEEIGGPHPFHLHGHAFSVVRSGDSKTYNYRNPVKRDTVNTGFADGNATIRFVTDNAGPWFLHCHIDWHLELGLAVVFAEDIPSINKDNIPPAWNDLCPIYDKLTPEQKGSE
ncbi:laccase, multicopper oxidase, benzenediol:oxygen oxidorectuctase [Tephrocybe rancida]|nr:laccase, multicopper oxidase, benzenediol:oxygen oxidorectuctase [Tephrocybe rancida]